ncbi:MAG: hypothetical protein LBM12_02160 [Candidatus Nomurabacteria bacterium]|nr:hypothetical protein [Candidatus Nomurabacteria bacterium]
MDELWIRGFDGWNKQKKRLEQTERRLVLNTGQVWWCAVGANLGCEAFIALYGAGF